MCYLDVLDLERTYRGTFCQKLSFLEYMVLAWERCKDYGGKISARLFCRKARLHRARPIKDTPKKLLTYFVAKSGIKFVHQWSPSR